MINSFKGFMSRFNADYFFGVPVDSKIIYSFIAFYVFVIIFFGTFFVMTRKKGELHKTFAKSLFYVNFSIALVGLFLVFSRYERVNIFSWRIWQYLLLASLICINLYYFFIKRQQLLLAIEADKSRQRKEKWLPKSKKRKK